MRVLLGVPNEDKKDKKGIEVRDLQVQEELPLELELRERICRKCDFYKEDDELECYAFKLSKKLVEEGKLTLDEL